VGSERPPPTAAYSDSTEVCENAGGTWTYENALVTCIVPCAQGQTTTTTTGAPDCGDCVFTGNTFAGGNWGSGSSYCTGDCECGDGPTGFLAGTDTCTAYGGNYNEVGYDNVECTISCVSGGATSTTTAGTTTTAYPEGGGGL